MRDQASVSTGFAVLDQALDGLYWGDNVLWELEAGASAEPFYAAVAQSAPEFHFAGRVVLAAGDDPPPVYPGVECVDAGTGALANPSALLEALAARCSAYDRDLILLPTIESLVDAWGVPAVEELFVGASSLMLEQGAIAYWTASGSREALSRDWLRRGAQCVIGIGQDRLRIVKADGRSRGVAGRLFRLDAKGDVPVLTAAPALSRVGEALRIVRNKLGLSQTDIARLAGVTPSAVSQAERGLRGLSLETLIELTDGLGLTLDQFLQGGAQPGYQLARRHDPRERGIGKPIPLLEDNDTGYRIQAVYLPPRGSAIADSDQDDAEIVIVASGLVQVLLPEGSPVLRQGEALFADRSGIAGWRNLSDHEALVFWLSRPRAGQTDVLRASDDRRPDADTFEALAGNRSG